MSNEWIAEKLAMGHPGGVSRVVSAGKSEKFAMKEIKDLEKVLIREQ